MGRILVVDTDLALCEMITVVLANEGHEVDCAHGLGEGLARAVEHQPAVILFNTRLFDGDGAELVAAYRQLPDATAVLIAVSGVANLGAEAARIGADGYLTKPLYPADLLAIVARALPGSTAVGDSAQWPSQPQEPDTTESRVFWWKGWPWRRSES